MKLLSDSNKGEQNDILCLRNCDAYLIWGFQSAQWFETTLLQGLPAPVWTCLFSKCFLMWPTLEKMGASTSDRAFAVVVPSPYNSHQARALSVLNGHFEEAYNTERLGACFGLLRRPAVFIAHSNFAVFLTASCCHF